MTTMLDRSQIAAAYGLVDGDPAGLREFALMPVGEAVDVGHAPDGTPLIDPALFDSAEFKRNPYPYYRILRDHYPVFRDHLPI